MMESSEDIAAALIANDDTYPYGVSRVAGLALMTEVCVDCVIARLQTSGKRHGLPAS